jgi:hypothetical protein
MFCFAPQSRAPKEIAMFPANTYRIWIASADDADALARLEEQASQPLVGRVLIGEIGGAPAAALSLHDGRAVTDGSRNADHLVTTLRMRAGAIRAYEATPSLPERLRAALPAYRGESIVIPPPAWHDEHDVDERLAA